MEPVFINWDTTGLAGTVAIFAAIDPNQVITETSELNNVASRHLVILPPAGDESPPVVTNLQVNGGAASTDDPQVVIAIEAEDTGGSGVSSMYLVEREFNSSARQWVAIQRTGWVDFQSPYTMTLTSRGGVRYIQAWAADGAGNISETIYKTRIDYIPSSDMVLAGQVRIYRRAVSEGQAVQVTLETLSGDADLYVWSPDGNESEVSNGDTITDTVSFTALQAGTYQIEVYGYQTSEYQLSIAIGSGATVQTVQRVYLDADKTERTQPVISPSNEPEGNSAVPAAPVISDSGPHRLYLALVLKG